MNSGVSVTVVFPNGQKAVFSYGSVPHVGENLDMTGFLRPGCTGHFVVVHTSHTTGMGSVATVTVKAA